MKVPLLSLALVLLLVFMVGIWLGRYGMRLERRERMATRKVELHPPLPRYLHVVDVEPLERRPTVRVIRPDEPEASEAVA